MKTLFFAGLLIVSIGIPVFAQTPCTIPPDTLHVADFCQNSTAPVWEATASANHELVWYKEATDTAGSTTKPLISNTLVGTQTVCVGQRLINDTTCKSKKLALSVNVVALPPAPTGTNPVDFCEGNTAPTWTVTPANGNVLLWYSNAIGGTASSTKPIIANTPAGEQIIWVSQKQNATPFCESPRIALSTYVVPIPPAPAAINPPDFCEGSTAPTWSATPKSGCVLQWYSVAANGTSITMPTITNSPIGIRSVWVSQKLMAAPGCESPRTKLAVNVVANPSAPAPNTLSNFCEGTIAPVWSVTASNTSFELGWYGASSGGAGIYGKPPLIASKPAGVRNIWVCQRTITAPKCESKRIQLSVNVLPLSDSKCINAQPDTANEFRGYVFSDLNNNKTKDANETYLTNVKVLLEPIGYATFTDVNGYYAIRVNQLGRFTISVQSAGYYMYSVKTDSVVSFFQAIDTDLGIKPVNFNDFKIRIIGLNLPEPGSNMNFILQIKNRGTETTNVNLKFITPYEYILQNASGMDSIISTNEWMINNISPGSTKTVTVFGKVSSDTYYNSVLSFKAIVVADDTDISFSSTEDEEILHWIYVSSPTSNYRISKEAPTYITPDQVAQGESIDYIIRFQNTGKDTIFSVTVADTLSQNLQSSSLEIVNTSHPCKTIVKGSYVHFEFQNIRLPDSSKNEPDSHGYVRFQVKPQNTLMLGDSIPNKAFVYFDNSNLMTNTVVTTVKEPIVTSTSEQKILNSGLTTFPNPSKDLLNVRVDKLMTGSQFELLEISGQSILKQTIKNNQTQIDISDLKAGTYLYRFTTNNGVKFGKVVKQ